MSDFWSTQPGTFAPLLTKERKEDLVHDGETFDIVGVKLGSTPVYGQTWFVDVVLDGERWAMAFSPNAQRDEQFEAMQSWFLNNPGQAIPSRLIEVNTKAGYTAYVLQPPIGGQSTQSEFMTPVDYPDQAEPPF